MNYLIKTDWKEFIDQLCIKHEEFLKIVENEYNKKTIFPKKELIFNCFNYFNKDELKVVIFGQDPYHGFGQANGLAFSVDSNQKTPSSLKNIFKELENDLNIKRTSSDLSDWAKQGILFLNTYLTVEKNNPLSHSKLGWETLINDIINYINLNYPNTIFVLMGNNAKGKAPYILNKKNIIATFHPSGLSANRGFFGCKLFTQINDLLEKNKMKKINW
ncbi:MAG: uracil-DNA glycosylase [Mycoplasmoidaceae bacterium]